MPTKYYWVRVNRKGQYQLNVSLLSFKNSLPKRGQTNWDGWNT